MTPDNQPALPDHVKRLMALRSWPMLSNVKETAEALDAAIESLRRAEGAALMSKETISAVLSEVLGENDDSISAGAFDEIVDRLAAPAKGATLGEGREKVLEAFLGRIFAAQRVVDGEYRGWKISGAGSLNEVVDEARAYLNCPLAMAPDGTDYKALAELLATPTAQRVAAGDGATDHEGRPLTYWGGKTPHSLATPPPTGEAVACEPFGYYIETMPPKAFESTFTRAPEIAEMQRLSSDGKVKVTLLYTHPAAQAEGRGVDDAMVERFVVAYNDEADKVSAGRIYRNRSPWVRHALKAALTAPADVGVDRG